MTSTIFIPRWRPATLNEMAWGHWSHRSKLKAVDRDMIGGYWLQSRLPLATGPRRVSLLVVLQKGQRAFDRDALFKSTLDALVKCGAIRNDSPAWCQLGTVSYARAIDAESWGTLITLEDLP